MPTLLLENLRFHYDSPYAEVFRDATLHIDTGWRAGVVGRNGRGKTTLLHLIQGRLVPQQGRVAVPVETTYFPHTPERPDLATRAVIRDSVAPYAEWEQRMEALLARGDEESLETYGELALEYERHEGYRIDSRIDEEWALMGLGERLLAQPFENLSGGEQTRALVLALFLRRDGYVLIDEPTNHLDAGGRAALADYLAAKPGFLLVSHDRAFLDRCADHIVSLERGEIRVWQSDYSGFLRESRREEEFEARERERLQREIRQLEVAARKRRTWSGRKEKEKRGAANKGFVGHRAAKLMKRALSMERRIHDKLSEKKSLLHIPEKKRALKLEPEGRSPSILLDVDQLGVAIEGRTLVEGLSLRVRRGDRVAIEGPNGSGKTLLLDTLAGERPPSEGRVYRPGYTGLCRATQIPRWSEGRLSHHLEREGIDETHFRGIMGVFGIEGRIFDRPLETFSEGERKKVDLCRSFLEPAELLLWDEPLNYLDIASREQIEEVILECEPTLVVVEHDRWFVERVATARISLG